jgi:ABC-2 type transport system permease protein
MRIRYWLRPTFSVAWKDIRIQLRYRTWFVASFIWPVIFPLTFFFIGRGLAGQNGQGLSTFASYAATSDFASFLIVGNLVWMFVNINLWMGGMSLQQDRSRGTFDTIWSLPVSRVSVVIGGTLSSMVLNFVPMAAALVLYAAMGIFRLGGSILDIAAATVLIMPFLVGFLFMFAAVTLRVRQAFIVVHLVRTTLSVLCGLQAPLAVLPGALARVGRYMPLTHYVDMLRGIIIHRLPLGSFGPSILYVLGTGAAMLGVGLAVFALVNRAVRMRGLSGGY